MIALEQIILIVHVLVALAIVGLVLIQQGKGADMGASFGAGGSQTLFGPSGGGNVLTRATAIFATIFFVTSISLAVIAKQKSSEIAVVDDVANLEALAEQQAINSEISAADELDIPADLKFNPEDPLDIVGDIPE